MALAKTRSVTGNASPEGGHNEISALKVIEYLLYAYAVYSFSTNVFLKANNLTEISNPMLSSNVWAATCFFLAVFILVILRVYVDIHAIDYDYVISDIHHQFISNNIGVYRFFEKAIRLLIVFSVLMVPKLYPGQLYQFVRAITGYVQSFLVYLCEIWLYIIGSRNNLDQVHKRDEIYSSAPHMEFHGILDYYATILFIIGILLITWDMVNAFSVQSKFKIRKFTYDGGAEGETERQNLFSFLDFIGVRSSFGAESSRFEYDHIILSSNPEPRKVIIEYIGKKILWLLYLRYSPRFRERFAVILFSLAAITCSRSELNIFSILSMGIFFTLFVVYSNRDSRLRRGISHVLTLPVKYFFPNEALVRHGIAALIRRNRHIVHGRDD